MVPTASPPSPLPATPTLTAVSPLFLLLPTIAACQAAEGAASMRMEEGLTNGTRWQMLEERWRRRKDRERKTREGEEGKAAMMGRRKKRKTEMMRDEKKGKMNRKEHESEKERKTATLKRTVTQEKIENGGEAENQSINTREKEEKNERSNETKNGRLNGREEEEENERSNADQDNTDEGVSCEAKDVTEEESHPITAFFSAFTKRTRRETQWREDGGQCWEGGRGHFCPKFTSQVLLRRNSVSYQGALLHPGNGGDFGEWGRYDMCVRGTYAHAFQLRVEEPLGILGDDTALTSVRLYCQGPTTLAAAGSITSAGQCWGAWQEPRTCGPGAFLWGLRLWVEKPQGVLDDVGATDLDMVCHDGRALNGGGVCWGHDSGWLTCPHGYVICGLRTRVESNAGLMGDNTALNDLMMMCCELR